MPATTARPRRPGNRATAQDSETMTEATATPTSEATTQTAPEGEASANGSARSKRNTAPIQITVPLDLKAQIKAQAEAAGKTEARWVLENIAGDLSYTLPAAPERATRTTALFPKSLTPEQKKERFDAARVLLAGLDRGEIDLAAIKAKLGL